MTMRSKVEGGGGPALVGASQQWEHSGGAFNRKDSKNGLQLFSTAGRAREPRNTPAMETPAVVALSYGYGRC